MKKIYYVDYAKVLAIFAVIVIHVSANVIYQEPEINSSNWIIGNFFDSISRWCVPIFIMVSGALLLSQKEISLGAFFKKRFSKVLIPLIAWNFIYLLFSYWTSEGFIMSLKFFIINFFSSGTYYHLWFMYMIIGLYLITPVLKIFISNASKRNLEYFLILWFLGNNFMIYFEEVTNKTSQLDISLVSGYVGYFALGYYLHKYSFKAGKFVLLGLISGLMVTFIGTQFLSNFAGRYDGLLYDYLSFNTMITAGTLYIIIKNVYENKMPSRFVQNITNSSFGIYLIHPIFIYLYDTLFGLNAFTVNPIFGIMVTSVIVFLTSILVTMLIRKTPFLKNITP